MSSHLRDNISSQYFEAANALRGKSARRRIAAYVESYDDIYFWRTVLSRFENEKRYFEVMLPSKTSLTKGKKSVLFNFLRQPSSQSQPSDNPASADHPAATQAADRTGPDMIACVDADYDYLMQGQTQQSRLMLETPYVFHTYVYAIENYQCYIPSLHDVCVAVTLNDHRIFNFEDYFREFSEIIFPLFVWSIWAYRTGNYTNFSISDFNRITDPGGFNVYHPEVSLKNIKRKVGVKIRELQKKYPENKQQYLKTKRDLLQLGVTPQTTCYYIQGHHLFDTVVAPILQKVCKLLQQERQAEIQHANAHNTQKRNEMSCYGNSTQDIKSMLKKNTGYIFSDNFRKLQADISKSLNETDNTY